MFIFVFDTPEEKDKFELLYFTYYKLMLYTANGILRDKAEAENVVHDVFVKLADNINIIGDVDSLRTKVYIMKMVKNKSIDVQRHGGKTFSASEVREEQETNISPAMDDEYESLEGYKVIYKLMRGLDYPYADVLLMHYGAEMSCKVIAKALDRKEATVRKQLQRGKQLLKDALEKEGVMK